MRKCIKNSTLQGAKKIICVILAIFMTLTFCGCSFVGEFIVSCIGEMFEEAPGFTYGDFECGYVSKASSIRRTSKEYAVGINIYGLEEEAQEKETIIIPESIDGLPVLAIGMGGLGWMRYLKGYYKKIYLPITLQFYSPYDAFWHKTIFLMDKPNDELMENRKILINSRLTSTQYSKFIIFESMYDWYQEFFSVAETSSLVIANLTYIADGVEYWMDDCANGEYVEVPPVPNKEGFVFDGWYLDEEFSNEWDFALNQYKKPEDSASLKLYAKFVAED